MDGCRVVERTKMLRAKPASIAYGEPKMRTYTYVVLSACDSGSLYASYAYAHVCVREGRAV